MSDWETARIIALNLLGVGAPPDEATVRSAAENAVQAVKAQAPSAEIEIDALVRELEANLNVVVGSASTLTDDSTDHIPWLPDRRASIGWSFTRRYQRFLNPNPPKDTDGRREDSGRGWVRELQGRWPGVLG